MASTPATYSHAKLTVYLLFRLPVGFYALNIRINGALLGREGNVICDVHEMFSIRIPGTATKPPRWVDIDLENIETTKTTKAGKSKDNQSLSNLTLCLKDFLEQGYFFRLDMKPETQIRDVTLQVYSDEEQLVREDILKTRDYRRKKLLLQRGINNNATAWDEQINNPAGLWVGMEATPTEPILSQRREKIENDVRTPPPGNQSVTSPVQDFEKGLPSMWPSEVTPPPNIASLTRLGSSCDEADGSQAEKRDHKMEGSYVTETPQFAETWQGDMELHEPTATGRATALQKELPEPLVDNGIRTFTQFARQLNEITPPELTGKIHAGLAPKPSTSPHVPNKRPAEQVKPASSNKKAGGSKQAKRASRPLSPEVDEHGRDVYDFPSDDEDIEVTVRPSAKGKGKGKAAAKKPPAKKQPQPKQSKLLAFKQPVSKKASVSKPQTKPHSPEKDIYEFPSSSENEDGNSSPLKGKGKGKTTAKKPPVSKPSPSQPKAVYSKKTALASKLPEPEADIYDFPVGDGVEEAPIAPKAKRKDKVVAKTQSVTTPKAGGSKGATRAVEKPEAGIDKFHPDDEIEKAPELQKPIGKGKTAARKAPDPKQVPQPLATTPMIVNPKDVIPLSNTRSLTQIENELQNNPSGHDGPKGKRKLALKPTLPRKKAKNATAAKAIVSTKKPVPAIKSKPPSKGKKVVPAKRPAPVDSSDFEPTQDAQSLKTRQSSRLKATAPKNLRISSSSSSSEYYEEDTEEEETGPSSTSVPFHTSPIKKDAQNAGEAPKSTGQDHIFLSYPAKKQKTGTSGIQPGDSKPQPEEDCPMAEPPAPVAVMKPANSKAKGNPLLRGAIAAAEKANPPRDRSSSLSSLSSVMEESKNESVAIAPVVVPAVDHVEDAHGIISEVSNEAEGAEGLETVQPLVEGMGEIHAPDMPVVGDIDQVIKELFSPAVKQRDREESPAKEIANKPERPEKTAVQPIEPTKPKDENLARKPQEAPLVVETLSPKETVSPVPEAPAVIQTVVQSPSPGPEAPKVIHIEHGSNSEAQIQREEAQVQREEAQELLVLLSDQPANAVEDHVVPALMENDHQVSEDRDVKMAQAETPQIPHKVMEIKPVQEVPAMKDVSAEVNASVPVEMKASIPVEVRAPVVAVTPVVVKAPVGIKAPEVPMQAKDPIEVKTPAVRNAPEEVTVRKGVKALEEITAADQMQHNEEKAPSWILEQVKDIVLPVTQSVPMEAEPRHIHVEDATRKDVAPIAPMIQLESKEPERQAPQAPEVVDARMETEPMQEISPMVKSPNGIRHSYKKDSSSTSEKAEEIVPFVGQPTPIEEKPQLILALGAVEDYVAPSVKPDHMENKHQKLQVSKNHGIHALEMYNLESENQDAQVPDLADSGTQTEPVQKIHSMVDPPEEMYYSDNKESTRVEILLSDDDVFNDVPFTTTRLRAKNFRVFVGSGDEDMIVRRYSNKEVQTSPAPTRNDTVRSSVIHFEVWH
jgi:hypothetical protein